MEMHCVVWHVPHRYIIYSQAIHLYTSIVEMTGLHEGSHLSHVRSLSGWVHIPVDWHTVATSPPERKNPMLHDNSARKPAWYSSTPACSSCPPVPGEWYTQWCDANILKRAGKQDRGGQPKHSTHTHTHTHTHMHTPHHYGACACIHTGDSPVVERLWWNNELCITTNHLQ